jgi:A/G-specific adenine glycosylase
MRAAVTTSIHTSTYTGRAEIADVPRRAEIAAALLDWYTAARRDLPWRQSRDPYCIWVSEIMLQQTQVATVIGFYERWMRRFPDVARLAAAEVEEVLAAWEGLGYYSRARNLRSAAQRLLQEHGGELPRSVEALRSLPGIGAYSAGAIASIAFGADEPAVDGNIIRVLTRLFALRGDPKRAPLSGRIWQLARALIPPGRARDFNQALMELGATQCTPRTPRCSTCPVRHFCSAFADDRVREFPESAPRPAVTEQRRAAALVRRGQRVLCVRNSEAAPRWAGLWQFPDVPLGDGEDAPAALSSVLERKLGISVGALTFAGSLRHQVTRFRIAVDVYSGSVQRGGRTRKAAGIELRWCDTEGLGELPMPTPHRKIARSLI